MFHHHPQIFPFIINFVEVHFRFPTITNCQILLVEMNSTTRYQQKVVFFVLEANGRPIMISFFLGTQSNNLDEYCSLQHIVFAQMTALDIPPI